MTKVRARWSITYCQLPIVAVRWRHTCELFSYPPDKPGSFVGSLELDPTQTGINDIIYALTDSRQLPVRLYQNNWLGNTRGFSSLPDKAETIAFNQQRQKKAFVASQNKQVFGVFFSVVLVFGAR